MRARRESVPLLQGLAERAATALDRIADPLGRAAGFVAAPVAWVGARVRHDRLFHARGTMRSATVVPLAARGPEHDLGMRLAGPALVRFSNVWWRAREWPDLLGLAIAFRVGEGVRKQQRQDLMLATVRRAWTFPWAVATTRWSDFLRNDYYGVARYTARGIGEVDVRARGEGGAGSTGSRAERLDEAVRCASAVLRIEVRRLGSREWVPVVKVEVREPRPEASGVRFDPFRTGAGLEPRGFVHAMRRAVYRASRAGAPVPLASNP